MVTTTPVSACHEFRGPVLCRVQGCGTFLPKQAPSVPFPWGCRGGEMRMIPQRSIGCGANGERPQREVVAGMSPLPAYAGTSARAEAGKDGQAER